MKSRKTMTYAVALAAASMLALAGCNGGDDEPTESSTPTSSTSESSSPTSSASPTSSTSPSPSTSVSIPAAAKANTEAGAVEFAKFYVLELNRADVASDATTISALSGPECQFCRDYVDIIGANKKAGLYLDKASWSIALASSLDAKSDGFVIGVLVEDSGSRRVDRTGKEVAKIPKGKFNFEAGVSRRGDGWFIDSLESK